MLQHEIVSRPTPAEAPARGCTGEDSRVFARLNLTSITKLAEPPELVLESGSLSITD